jgi:hypothetical protein
VLVAINGRRVLSDSYETKVGLLLDLQQRQQQQQQQQNAANGDSATANTISLTFIVPPTTPPALSLSAASLTAPSLDIDSAAEWNTNEWIPIGSPASACVFNGKLLLQIGGAASCRTHSVRLCDSRPMLHSDDFDQQDQNCAAVAAASSRSDSVVICLDENSRRAGSQNLTPVLALHVGGGEGTEAEASARVEWAATLYFVAQLERGECDAIVQSEWERGKEQGGDDEVELWSRKAPETAAGRKAGSNSNGEWRQPMASGESILSRSNTKRGHHQHRHLHSASRQQPSPEGSQLGRKLRKFNVLFRELHTSAHPNSGSLMVRLPRTRFVLASELQGLAERLGVDTDTLTFLARSTHTDELRGAVITANRRNHQLQRRIMLLQQSSGLNARSGGSGSSSGAVSSSGISGSNGYASHSNRSVSVGLLSPMKARQAIDMLQQQQSEDEQTTDSVDRSRRLLTEGTDQDPTMVELGKLVFALQRAPALLVHIGGMLPEKAVVRFARLLTHTIFAHRSTDRRHLLGLVHHSITSASDYHKGVNGGLVRAPHTILFMRSLLLEYTRREECKLFGAELLVTLKEALGADGSSFAGSKAGSSRTSGEASSRGVVNGAVTTAEVDARATADGAEKWASILQHKLTASSLPPGILAICHWLQQSGINDSSAAGTTDAASSSVSNAETVVSAAEFLFGFLVLPELSSAAPSASTSEGDDSKQAVAATASTLWEAVYERLQAAILFSPQSGSSSGGGETGSLLRNTETTAASALNLKQRASLARVRLLLDDCLWLLLSADRPRQQPAGACAPTTASMAAVAAKAEAEALRPSKTIELCTMVAISLNDMRNLLIALRQYLHLPTIALSPTSTSPYSAHDGSSAADATVTDVDASLFASRVPMPAPLRATIAACLRSLEGNNPSSGLDLSLRGLSSPSPQKKHGVHSSPNYLQQGPSLASPSPLPATAPGERLHKVTPVGALAILTTFASLFFYTGPVLLLEAPLEFCNSLENLIASVGQGQSWGAEGIEGGVGGERRVWTLLQRVKTELNRTFEEGATAAASEAAVNGSSGSSLAEDPLRSRILFDPATEVLEELLTEVGHGI